MTTPDPSGDAVKAPTIEAHDLGLAANLVFVAGNSEALRISPDGTLTFKDASEAAKALHREWLKLHTPPTVSLDEVEAVIENLTELATHPCRAGSSLASQLLDAVALLTRIKGRQ